MRFVSLLERWVEMWLDVLKKSSDCKRFKESYRITEEGVEGGTGAERLAKYLVGNHR